MHKKRPFSLKTKIITFFFGFSVVLASFFSFFTYFRIEASIVRDFRDVLHAICVVGAKSVNRETLELVNTTLEPDAVSKSLSAFDDTKPIISEDTLRLLIASSSFKSLIAELQTLRESSPELIKSIYILAPSVNPKKAVFIADADIVYEGDSPEWNSIPDASPGQLYTIANLPAAQKALTQKTVVIDTMFRLDTDYGTYILAGFAPIVNKNGDYLGTLCIDISLDRVTRLMAPSMTWFFIIVVMLLIISFIVSVFASKYFLHTLRTLTTVVKRFTEKDFDARSMLPKTNDEIGILSESFNTLADEIQKFSKHLEDNVALRTTELSDAYNVLQRNTDEMTRDLLMAQRIQQKIIPQPNEMPKRDELSFGSYYNAMANIGGDLYDIIRIGRNAYGFLIADVSGHGVPAALITTMVKVAFQTKAHWGVRTDTACMQVNDELYKVMSDMNHYVTAYFGIINLETGVFQYTNCGHHATLLIREPNEIIKLDSEGKFLGIFDNVTYEAKEITLQEGDRLLFFTDGIIEARNLIKDQYEYKRLFAYIDKNRHLNAKDFVDSLVKDIDFFTMGAKQNDDQAIFCIDFHKKSEFTDEQIEAQHKNESMSKTGEEQSLQITIEQKIALEREEYQNEFRRALKFIQEHKLFEAETILMHLKLQYPTDTKVMNNLGIIYYKQLNLHKALAEFELAYKFDPKNTKLHANITKLRELISKQEGKND